MSLDGKARLANAALTSSLRLVVLLAAVQSCGLAGCSKSVNERSGADTHVSGDKSTATPSEKASPPSTAKRPGLPIELTSTIGMKLLLIPVGEFQMGSPVGNADGSPNEKMHRVKITKPFYLGSTEVTQGEWKAVMGTEPWRGGSYVQEGLDYPATYVSWDDTMEFCRKLTEIEWTANRLAVKASFTLPTEAQWEYSCRAGTATAFSFSGFSSDLSMYAWYDKNAWDVDEKYAHRVGQKQENPWGLYDMHGNVFEWCSDWYDNDYDYYGESPVNDPPGSTVGSSRVLRGGSWDYPAKGCRSANRRWDLPSSRNYFLGFRVVAIPKVEQ
jgi:sulfatase modifying factor 1